MYLFVISKEERSIEARKKATLIAKAAKSKKAEDIIILDLRGISTFCDYFVICDATSITRIEAISRGVKEALEKRDSKIGHIEGAPESRWVLIDSGDVIIHIFHRETRNFYGLERLWGDAPILKMEKKRSYVSEKKEKKK